MSNTVKATLTLNLTHNKTSIAKISNKELISRIHKNAYSSITT